MLYARGIFPQEGVRVQDRFCVPRLPRLATWLRCCEALSLPLARQPTDHPGGFYAPLTEGIRLCNFKADPSLPPSRRPLPSGYMEYLTCLVAHVAFELEKIRSSYPPIPSSPTQTARRKDLLTDFIFGQGDSLVPSRVCQTSSVRFLHSLTNLIEGEACATPLQSVKYT